MVKLTLKCKYSVATPGEVGLYTIVLHPAPSYFHQFANILVAELLENKSPAGNRRRFPYHSMIIIANALTLGYFIIALVLKLITKGAKKEVLYLPCPFSLFSPSTFPCWSVLRCSVADCWNSFSISCVLYCALVVVVIHIRGV